MKKRTYVIICVVGVLLGFFISMAIDKFRADSIDDGKDPVVTYNEDGTVSIDRLDPGESVVIESEITFDDGLHDAIFEISTSDGDSSITIFCADETEYKILDSHIPFLADDEAMVILGLIFDSMEYNWDQDCSKFPATMDRFIRE